MRRVIINCLLLASIVTAVPDGRHKRHFAFLKDLMTSTLFGETQTTIVEPQAEYKLYRVPGFDDVLIKSTFDLPKEATTIVKPSKEVLEIHPIEAYIGTENEQDTITAFDNVHNLLSTGVLNRKQSKLVQETIGPMISGVNAIKIVSKENTRPVKIVSKTVQPILTDKLLPKKAKVFSDLRVLGVKTAPVMCETIPPESREIDASVKLEVPNKPRYSFTQMEKSGPVTTFTQLGPKLTVRRKVNASPVLPTCIKQRIDEVVSIGAIPQRRVDIKGGLFLAPHDVAVEHYPYEVNRFPSLGPNESIKDGFLHQPAHVHGPRKMVAQEIVTHPPVIHYIQPKNSPASSKSIKNVFDITTDKSETVKVNNASVVKSFTTVAETAVKESKNGIVSHYSYRQVSNNKPLVPNILKDNDKLNTINYVKTLPVLSSTPKVINYVNVIKNNNLLKTSGTASSHKPVSNNVYKDINHNNFTGFNIAKQKEESNDTPFSNKHGSTSSTLGTAPKLTNSVNFNKNAEHVSGGENQSKDKPVSHYAYKQVQHGNSNVFSVAKESDKVHTDSSLPNNVQISYVAKTPIVMTSSNTRITTDNIARSNYISSNIAKSPDSVTEDHTLSQYIYKQLSHNNPPAFSILRKEDEVKSNLNTDSSFPKNYVYMPPYVHSSPAIKLDHNVKSIDGKSDSAATDKTLSQYINKQFSHYKSHSFGTLDKNYVYMPPEIGKAPIINASIRTAETKPVDNLPKKPISPFTVFSMVKEGDKLKTNIKTDSVPVDYTTAKVDDVKDFLIKAVPSSSERATEGARKGILGIPPVLKENGKVKTNIIINSVPVDYTTAKVDVINDFSIEAIPLNSEKTTEGARKGILGIPPVVKESGKVNTNIITDSVSVDYTTAKIDVKDFSSEAVASSSESATEGDRKGILGISPVLKESDKISFKDNPIVVADLDSNYKYHQSNVDGSLVSVKGNKKGVAINVDRGDIPK